MSSQKRLAINVILLCVLIVRIIAAVEIYWNSERNIPAYPLAYPFQLDRDPNVYLAGASQIIDTGMNKLNFFPPLHFLFLAGCLYLGNGNIFIPALACVLVGWFTVVGIFLLAKRLFDDRVALIATVICGLYPNLIIYELSFYPETLALLWVVFSFLVLVKYFDDSRSFYLVLSGILWGFASQTRGGLYIFAFLIATALVISHLRETKTLAIKTAGIFLTSTFTTIFLIGIIFFPIHGDFRLNTKTGIGAAIIGVNRISTSCTDYGHIRGNIYYGILPEEKWPEGSRINTQELVKLETWKIFIKLASFISQDPFTYVKNSLGKLSCLWSPNQLMIKYLKMIRFKESNESPANAWCLGISALYIVIVGGGLCGVALATGPFRLVFILLILFYNAMIFLTVGNSKLRLPMMPFIMIYCAYFFTLMFNGASWKKLFSHKWLMVIMIVFICNSIYKVREFLPTPPEVYLKTLELRNKIGFPKTVLNHLRKAPRYTFTQNQNKRLTAVKQSAEAELYVRLVEQFIDSGQFREALYYLNENLSEIKKYTFSEIQKERMKTAQRVALSHIYEGNIEQFNNSESLP